MATPRSFELYELDGVTPKTNATPSLAIVDGGVYSLRDGTPRTPPAILSHSNGNYSDAASDADEAIGVVALIVAAGALPTYTCQAIATPALSFAVVAFFDVNGNPWAGAAPTIGYYTDLTGVAQARPSLLAVGAATHLFSLTPTPSDRLAGRYYRIDAPAGAYPAAYADTFYFNPAYTGGPVPHRDSGFNRGFD